MNDLSHMTTNEVVIELRHCLRIARHVTYTSEVAQFVFRPLYTHIEMCYERLERDGLTKREINRRTLPDNAQ